MQIAEKASFSLITFLRFIFALWVFAAHFAIGYWGSSNTTQNLYFYGSIGVTCFFVLSGFVISTSQFSKIEAGNFSIRKYYIDRLVRVLPAFWISLVIAILSLGLLNKSIPGDIWQSFLFLDYLSPQTIARINGPGWSLLVEVFFYLLFPGIAYTLLKANTKARNTILILIWMAFTFVYFALFQRLINSTSNELEWLLQYTPLFHLGSFAIGLLFAEFYRLIKNIKNIDILAPIILITSVIVLYCSIIYFPWYQIIGDIGSVLPGELSTNVVQAYFNRVLLNGPILAPLIGLVILSAATIPKKLNNFFNNSFFNTLGDASYSFYILQFPVFTLLKNIFEYETTSNIINGVHYFVKIEELISFLTLLITIAVLNNLIIEKPIKAIFSKN